MLPEVSTAGADHDREPTAEVLKRELAEAREQQAATAGILAAISNAPSDPSCVFAEIAASAARLCNAQNADIVQMVGGRLRFLAHHGPLPILSAGIHLTRRSVIGRAIIDKRTIHVTDLQSENQEYPEGSELVRQLGHRTIVVTPLVRLGEAIGAIAIRRADVRPFNDRQIQLLKTFADQAVIAIENTRLFEEVQARTRELNEALEQKTATSEVLSVISRSKLDLQPVFDTMAENAVKLCHAERAFIFRYDGSLLKAVASYNVGPELRAFVDQNPISPGRHSISARAALERRTVHVPDVQSDPEYAYAARDVDLIR